MDYTLLFSSRYRAKNRKNAVRLMKLTNDIKEEREDGDGVASGEETVYGSPPLESTSIRKGLSLSFYFRIFVTFTLML